MTVTTDQSWSRTSAEDGTVNLVVQRCTNCDQVVFPPTAERCSRCWSAELTVDETPGAGSVYSYTVVRRSFPGLETPYVVGLVDLDGGLRVMTTITADDSQLAVGARVVAAAAAERAGMPATAYQFRPAG
jgi:uncharacterized OB-fold protein